MTGPGDGPAGPDPAAFRDGPGRVIRRANAPYFELLGAACLAVPAREAMTGLGREGFARMDRVLRERRPPARPVATPAGRRRLVVVPRVEPETDAPHGVVTHLWEPDAA